jgi:hypothetical protein
MDQSKGSQSMSELPTILVVGLASTLAPDLRSEGYLVLEAHSDSEAVSIARYHSRPIHLLLIDTENQNLAKTIRQYRHKVHVLFVEQDDQYFTLKKVRQFFESRSR